MRCSASTLLVLTLSANGAFGTAAPADTAALTDTAAPQDIIITARRSAEPDWSVPLAITTVTHEEIERRGIMSLEDLPQSVPGLAYSYGRGIGGVPIIRGLNAFNVTSNQNSVATLIDGIYVSNAFAVDVSMLDLEAIDVLRGPQNALVGRNAFAGAILYQPAQPTQTPQSGAQIDAGSGAFGREVAYLSGPLRESLTGRLAAMHESFDGTIHNLGDPRHNLGGWDKSSVSGTLLWSGNEGTRAKLSGFWYQNQRDATARFGFGNVPPLYNCGLDPSSGRYINYCGAIPVPDAVDISPDARGMRSQTTLGRLEVQHSWRSVTVTSLTGYVQTRIDNPPDDWDLSSAGELIPVARTSAPDTPIRLQRANVYFTGFPLDDHEWSEELRLAGTSPQLHWLAGLYWARNRSLTHVGYSADGRGLAPDETFISSIGYSPTLTPLVPLPYGDIAGHNDIDAAFGSFTYAVSPAFDASVELRWNEEQIWSQTTFAGSSPDPAQSGSWAFVTPRFTLQYKWPGQMQLYASAAKGARSGGFNDSPVPAEAEYAAETNWTYELGFKASAVNERLHGWVALYQVNWTNVQLDAPSQDPTVPFPVTRNIGAATVRGLELSVESRATDWLELQFDYAYADARFNPGTIDLDIAKTCTAQICHLVPAPPSGALVPDVGGNQLPGAPRHSAAANATFHGDLPRGLHWYVHAGLYGASREFVRSDNLNWLAPQWIGNARLGLLGGRWELALWGRDLASLRTGFANIAMLDSGGRQFVADRVNGATWGMSFAYRFP